MNNNHKVMVEKISHLNYLLTEKKFEEIKQELIKITEDRVFYSNIGMSIGFYQFTQKLLAKGGIEVFKFLLDDERFKELDLKNCLENDTEFLMESIYNRNIEAVEFGLDFLNINSKLIKEEGTKVLLHVLFKYIHDFSFFEQVFPILDKRLEISANTVLGFTDEIIETDNYLIVQEIFERYCFKENASARKNIDIIYLKAVARGQLEIINYLEDNFTISLENIKENKVLETIFESGNISIIEKAFSSKIFKKYTDIFSQKNYIIAEIKNDEKMKVALYFLSKNPSIIDNDMLMMSLISYKREKAIDYMIEKEICLPSDAFIQLLSDNTSITNKLKEYLVTRNYNNLNDSLNIKDKKKLNKI